jgi:hypothetical protein
MTDLIDKVAEALDGWVDPQGLGWGEEAKFAAHATLSAINAAGYAVVPKEPTDPMWFAGHAALETHGESARASCWAYVAMLAAAPKVTP